MSILYLLDRGALSAVLSPDADGVPIVCNPHPLVMSCEYLSLDFVESQLTSALGRLTSEKGSLFVPITSPDGPPYRSGTVFTFQEVVRGASWMDGNVPRHGAVLRKFAATTPMGNWTWITEAAVGRAGYFLMGHSGYSALWRIFRVEVDALRRSVLTLAPVQFTSDCPTADFHNVADDSARIEAAQQYEDLGRRVSAGAYRDVPTKARNIVEGLLATKLKSQGRPGVMELGRDLQAVKSLLENPSTRSNCGWTDLEYHLLQKIRLVHAQTHAGAVIAAGRTLRSEFAMSVVDDLVELLRMWGYVHL